MASVLALTGFQYSAVDNIMNFNVLNGEYFWSTGYAYGNIKQSGDEKNRKITINVLNGKIKLNQFVVNEFGKVKFEKLKQIATGDNKSFTIAANDPTVGKRIFPDK